MIRLLFIFLFLPIKAFALIEVDITRGNLNPLPIAVSPLSIDENSRENFKKILPNFIYELEYEKFVKNPESEAKKLINFCGIKWNKKCLEFYKRKDLISKTASNIQIRNAVYTDSINKYAPYREFLEKYGKKYSWFN